MLQITKIIQVKRKMTFLKKLQLH